ncbi:MAG: phosphotyrosine protein phosphatase [Gammaproteobacteria bacterium]|nr:phosphotyrosine protein phosphatase [Gammaproteobacteria bacterium]
MVVDSEKDNRWIARHFGSRRGFVRTYWYRLLYYLGTYRKYKDIDWQSVERLVFVCKGNICRSAYAEVVARSLGIDAISCGLDTIENAQANESAIRAAKIRGFNLDEHRTRPVMYLVFKKTDLLIAMESWQCEFLTLHLRRKHQCTLLGLWGAAISPHIQDPYGSSSEYFEKCFSYIEKSVNEIAKKIKY